MEPPGHNNENGESDERHPPTTTSIPIPIPIPTIADPIVDNVPLFVGHLLYSCPGMLEPMTQQHEWGNKNNNSKQQQQQTTTTTTTTTPYTHTKQGKSDSSP